MYNLKWRDRPIGRTSARPLPGTEVTLLLRNHGASGVGQVNACSVLIHVSHLLIFICFSIMFHFSKMYLAVHFSFLSSYQRVPCTSQHLHKRKGKEGYICDVPGEHLEWPVVTNLAPECTDGVHLNTGGGQGCQLLPCNLTIARTQFSIIHPKLICSFLWQNDPVPEGVFK